MSERKRHTEGCAALLTGAAAPCDCGAWLEPKPMSERCTHDRHQRHADYADDACLICLRARVAELEGAVREWAEARHAFLALPALSFDEKGWRPDKHTVMRDAAFTRIGLAELRMSDAVLNSKPEPPNE